MTFHGGGHWDPAASPAPQTGGDQSTTFNWVVLSILGVVIVVAAVVIGFLVLVDDEETSPVVAQQQGPAAAATTAENGVGAGSGDGDGENDAVGDAADTTPTSTTAGPCDESVMARDMGRDRSRVNVAECRGDWAYVSVIPPEHDGPAGDPMYVARRVDGAWTHYVSIPSTECLDDAIADGMPGEWGVGGMSTDCGGQQAGTGGADLGIGTPISNPPCDDRGVVILHSAVTPGQYAGEVGAALAANPGASYLRTDQSCPSLRSRDDAGNLIYAVYRLSGYTQSEICADVAAAGGGAYGRWLSNTRSATELVTC